MKNSIDIQLTGSTIDLSAIFSFTSEKSLNGLTNLETYIGHAFNLTLQRDGIFGGWAKVWQHDGLYNLKISSPHHDLSAYEEKINDFLAAAREALCLLKANQSKIDQLIKSTGKQMRFILPFGTAMASTRAVQLLHFPPIESYDYTDYLFSPTNRRWENLLGYNGVKGDNFSELESIVDCVPLGAPGGDNEGINPFNDLFSPYVKMMLQARLRTFKKITVPLIAYGSPVHYWLAKNFADQVKEVLTNMTFLEIDFFGDGTLTPVLCAHHPSEYLYYSDKPNTAEKTQILTEDLIAAGWQARMAQHPDEPGKKVLDSLMAYWKENPKIPQIMMQEDQAYNFNP